MLKNGGPGTLKKPYKERACLRRRTTSATATSRAPRCEGDDATATERAEQTKERAAEFVRGRLGDDAAAMFTRDCEVTVTERRAGRSVGTTDARFSLCGVLCRSRAKVIDELRAKTMVAAECTTEKQEKEKKRKSPLGD